MGFHETRPVQVWVDADLGIADLVIYLNTIPEVRTDSSCQGTIGEGGPHPYRGYVVAQWSGDALKRLLLEGFDVDLLGNDWGQVYLKR